MNFDVRSYCERLAKAMPERFKFVRGCPDNWALGLPSGHLWADADVDHFWAFIGPLADELGVRELQCAWHQREKRTEDKPYRYNTLLEATFAACCKKLEAAKP